MIARGSFLRHHRFPLLFALILGLGLRVGITFFTNLPWYNSDTYHYKEAARSILAGQWSPIFPPGYPLLIAFLSILSGGHEDTPLILCNIACSIATIFLAYWACWRWSENRTLALSAGLIIACWPNQINYVRQLLTEAPTALLLMAAVSFAIIRRPLSSGFLLGIATLFRTTLAPVGLLILIPVLRRSQWHSAARLFIGFLIPTVATATMSWQRQGTFSLGDNTRSNFYIALNSFGNDVQFLEQPTHRFREAPGSTTADARSIYIHAHLEEPRHFIGQRLAAFWELWGPYPFGSDRSSPAKLLIGLRTPLLVFGLLGMWFKRQHAGIAMAFLSTLTITTIHTAFFATPRFTYVLEPILIPLAAIGFYETYTRLSKKRRLSKEGVIEFSKN